MATEPKHESDILFERSLHLLGGAAIGEPAICDRASLERAVRRGLDDEALFNLVSAVPVLRQDHSLERVMAGAAPDTIIVNGRLCEDDGWRLWRLVQLVCKAGEVLDDMDAGCRWLQRYPLDAAGNTALDVLSCAERAASVMDRLIRIEYTVYI